MAQMNLSFTPSILFHFLLRVFIVILCGISILWIPLVKSSQGGQLFIYLQAVQTYLGTPIGPVFIWAILWKRMNEKVRNGLSSLCIHALLYITMQQVNKNCMLYKWLFFFIWMGLYDVLKNISFLRPQPALTGEKTWHAEACGKPMAIRRFLAGLFDLP